MNFKFVVFFFFCLIISFSLSESLLATYLITTLQHSHYFIYFIYYAMGMEAIYSSLVSISIYTVYQYIYKANL
jgi:hypothetical protein